MDILFLVIASVAKVIGYIKGKSAIVVARQFGG
jgi:hypothetical protein